MKYKLYHTFDAKHAKNLGEESVSDNVQATIELAKNAYDGDATTCKITFLGVPDKIQGIIVRKIVVEDDGIGMSFNDIANKWLNIGTQNKIQEPLSPIKGRKVVGAKGIGHFACQKLGNKITIISNPLKYPGREHLEHIDKTMILTQDWSDYVAGKNFSDIPNEINIVDRDDPESHGVTIEIEDLKQKWTINDVERVRLKLGLLLLPPSILKNQEDDFTIILDANAVGIDDAEITNDVMKYAPYKLHGKLRGKKLSWDISRRIKGFERQTIDDYYDDGKGSSARISSSVPFTNNKCGDLDVMIYHFPIGPKYWEHTDGLGAFPSEELKTAAVKKAIRDHSGIKIYKDKVRIMPYGDPGDDWLGLEERRHGGQIGNTAILGFVLLSSDKNPEIQETTTRQKLIANEAYVSLAGPSAFADKNMDERSVMITLIRKLEVNWARVQRKKKETKKNSSDIVQTRLKQARNEIAKLPDTMIPPDVKETLTSQLTEATSEINNLESQYEEEIERTTSLEELYRGLASFAIAQLAFQHETRDPVMKIGGAINDLKTSDLSEEEKEERIALAWKEYETLRAWRSYTKNFADLIAGTKKIADIRSEIDLEDICNNINANQKAALITERGEGGNPDKKIKIRFQPIGELGGIHGNPLHFWSIFNNMITNSIKALKSVERDEHKITIKAYKDTTWLVMEFTDNGIGISDEHIDNIYRLWYSGYKDHNKGMGMGLSLVKDIVEVDYDGIIKVDQQNADGKGSTTFLIKIPLKELK